MFKKRSLVLCLLFLSLLTPLFGAISKKPRPQRKPMSPMHQLRQQAQAGTSQMQMALQRDSSMRQAYMERMRNRVAMPNRLTRGVMEPGAIAPTFGFVAAPELQVGEIANGPTTTADFNSDGKPDVATLDQYYAYDLGWRTEVVVMLSNGDGTFTRVTTDFGQYWGWSIESADFNKDGKPDLFIHNRSNSAFYTLLGKGDGTFQPAVATVQSDATSYGASVVDANGDGIPDIVSGALGSAFGLRIYLGDGTGAFGAPIQVEIPGDIYYVEFRDLNGDGKFDIIADGWDGCCNYDLHTLIQQDDGSFALSFASDRWADGFDVADVNGDGKLDIVASSMYPNEMTTYLGDGMGGFTQTSSIFPGYNSNAVVLADVNGDGRLDAISSNYYGGDVTVALGNGDGSFALPTVGYAVGGDPYFKASVADLDGDGKADIVANNFRFAVALLKGYGDGSFKSALNYWIPPTADDSWGYGYTIAKGDFNHDGVPDFVIGLDSAGSQQPTIFFGNVDGTVTRSDIAFSPYSMYVTVADLNGDGWDDVAFANDDTGNIELWLNDGAGAFPTMVEIPTASWPSGLVAADFNNDGAPDLAFSDGSTVYVYPNDGSGNFDETIYSQTSLPTESYTLTVGDVNKDGNLDVVVVGDPGTSVLYGLGDGTFDTTTAQVLSTQSGQVAAIGDLNGDGTNDLAITVGPWGGDGVLIWMGNGDGSFQSPNYVSTTKRQYISPYTHDIQMVDLNGDGYQDLLVANGELGTVALLYGKGDGTFFDPTEYFAGSYPWALSTADINNDGALDVVAVSDDFPGITVLLNNSGSVIVATPEHNPVTYGTTNSVAIALGSVVRGVTAQPTGDVAITVDAGDPMTAPITNGQATFDASTLAAGSRNIAINYAGDANFMPHTTSIVIQVDKAATTTTLTSSSNPATINHPVTFTATVASTTSGTPTGDVTFKNGTTALATVALQDGTATFTTSALALGTHDITVEYAGDSNFVASTSEVLAQVVQLNATATALASSKNPANIIRPVTFTATVTGAIGVATGNVVFYDGATALGTVALDATGKAAYSTTALALGSHSITAAYQGSASYAASTSAVLTQVIQNNPADYTLTATPTTLALKRGQNGTITITLTPQNEFDGTATFACGPLATGISCQFNPLTLHPTTSAPVTTTLVISTVPAAVQSSTQPVMGMVISFGGLAFGAVLIGGGRRRRSLIIVGIILLIVASVMMSGCGSPSSSTPTPVTPLGPQTISVNVTATAGTYNGSTALHTITVPITIQQ